METMSTNQTQPGGLPQTLPNSNAVLVLGILSLVFCWCWIFGLPLGIIALTLAKGADKMYKTNPLGYSEGTYNNLKAGRVCAIIGTCISGLFFLFGIIYWIIVGTAFWSIFSGMPWEQFKHM
jgi:hypothetical protein